MDWIRDAMLGGGEENLDLFAKACQQGDEEARKFIERLIALGKPMADGGNPMEASALMFTALFRALGMAKAGVDKSVQVHGPNSPVLQLWNLLGQSLTTATTEEALAVLAKFKKEKGLD